jgi:hypothetical protein
MEWIGMKKIAMNQVETSFKKSGRKLGNLLPSSSLERDRKIYGLKQHNRNLEDKLGRIGGYHYGNPKQ